MVNASMKNPSLVPAGYAELLDTLKDKIRRIRKKMPRDCESEPLEGSCINLGITNGIKHSVNFLGLSIPDERH